MLLSLRLTFAFLLLKQKSNLFSIMIAIFVTFLYSAYAFSWPMSLILVRNRGDTLYIPLQFAGDDNSIMKIGPVFIKGCGSEYLRKNGSRIYGNYFNLLVQEQSPQRFAFQLEHFSFYQQHKAEESPQESLVLHFPGVVFHASSKDDPKYSNVGEVSKVHLTRIFQYVDLLHVMEYLALKSAGLSMERPKVTRLAHKAMLVNRTLNLTSSFERGRRVFYPTWKNGKITIDLKSPADELLTNSVTVTRSKCNPYFGCLFDSSDFPHLEGNSRKIFHFQLRSQCSFAATAFDWPPSGNPELKMQQLVEDILLSQPVSITALASLTVTVTSGKVSATLIDWNNQIELHQKSLHSLCKEKQVHIFPDSNNNDKNSYLPNIPVCISFLQTILKKTEETYFPAPYSLLVHERHSQRATAEYPAVRLTKYEKPAQFQRNKSSLVRPLLQRSAHFQKKKSQLKRPTSFPVSLLSEKFSGMSTDQSKVDSEQVCSDELEQSQEALSNRISSLSMMKPAKN